MEATHRIQMEPRLRQSLAILRSTLLSLIICAGLATSAVPAATPTEYQLKAVFLFNFIQFVEWPSDDPDAEQQPICVGILGADPFGPELDAVMQGEQIKGRAIVVERFADVSEVDDCQLLFIGTMDDAALREAVERLEGRPILTVGETPEFIDAGGMIRFLTESNRIRLQVNLRAADAAHLRLSSKLLRSSQIVARAEN